MATKECCRSCKHCIAGHAVSFCRIRKIKVHPEISTFAFCHHWTKKEPLLPPIEEAIKDSCTNKQLEFAKVLIER